MGTASLMAATGKPGHCGVRSQGKANGLGADGFPLAAIPLDSLAQAFFKIH